MANMRDANIMKDFTVWIDGSGKIGEAPGFQPPDIQIQTETFRGGGMDGEVDIPMGIEKIEFDFDLHTWDQEVWNYLGYGPGSLDTPIVFRGYLQTPAGAEKAVLIETRSLIKSIKTSKVEPGKKVEMTVSCNARYYKHQVNGVLVNEIDLFDKVVFINGVDVQAGARDILDIA